MILKPPKQQVSHDSPNSAVARVEAAADRIEAVTDRATNWLRIASFTIGALAVLGCLGFLAFLFFFGGLR